MHSRQLTRSHRSRRVQPHNKGKGSSSDYGRHLHNDGAHHYVDSMSTNSQFNNVVRKEGGLSSLTFARWAGRSAGQVGRHVKC